MTVTTEQNRIHRAVSEDGTEIAGHVYGEGPPLVLVHGAMADGLSEWSEILPLLTDRFTCYLPSTRGRGLSGRHPTHTREKLVQDVTAFVDSIGEPVGIFGTSGGGMVTLGTAARASAVTAVAANEPVVFEVMTPQLREGFRDEIDAMAKLAKAGRAAEAAATFLEFAGNDEEVAALSEDEEGLELIAENLQVDLDEFYEAVAFEGYSPTDPAVLERIAVPVLLLHGSRTAKPWFTESTQFVAHHVPDPVVREIPGHGHLGHLMNPKPVADEVVAFFGRHLEPRAAGLGS